MAMTWVWKYEASAGGEAGGQSEAFASQADAESWIGQEWRALANTGVAQVGLYEGDRLEYTMSLAPATPAASAAPATPAAPAS